MLESIKGLRGWGCKDNKMIYKLWRRRIMKQDELNGDLEFIVTIRLGGKWASYRKTCKRKFRKWKGVCRAYRNPITKFDVG